ncbi:nuclear transport factor 2 family protein [Sorangium sp. So ce136]|uniref:nuclear transport factor 2 family protein n=1 Tax=Sorangium sp. So ce136 TaxID=3133284 RepID=UPI003F081BE8
MDHPNVAIVQRMYERFGAGDMDTIRDQLFTSDILWHLPGHHPLAGTMRGPDEVLAFFQTLLGVGIKIDMKAITGTDTYVINVHRAYTDQDSTISLECAVHQIRGGRIAEVQVLSADQHAIDAYLWAKVNLKPLPDRLAGSEGVQEHS